MGFPTRAAALGLVLLLLGPGYLVQSASSQSEEPIIVHIEGTVADAAGKLVPAGEVQVSFAGGGDFKEQVKGGYYVVKAEFPREKPLPLMIKLTYYVDGFPPRWVEHLSPRLPRGEKQKLHVVVYTDDQLKQASLGELYLEGQQLETSLVFWVQPDNRLKEVHRRSFSYALLNKRRQLIYESWEQAAQKAKFPKEYGNQLRERFSDRSLLATQMKTSLPSE